MSQMIGLTSAECGSGSSMSEERVLAAPNVASRKPVTPSRLAKELRKLGVAPGMTLMVHTSLSKLGWVPGGAQGVIVALLDVLGESGTLVMPAHSGHLSDPSGWQAPPVPKPWWRAIRKEMPAYDPALTPTRMMGAVAETFRKHPDVKRSAHPHVSFAALGPNADVIVAEHPVGDMFGERSPLARLYDLDASVLLAGVTHANNTSIHLAETRADFPSKGRVREGAPMTVNGKRRWVTFEDWQVDDGDFAALGEDFACNRGSEQRGPLGWGEGRLMRMRAIVDFAQRWLAVHRSVPPA